MSVLADLREALQIFDVLPTGVLLLDSTGAVLRYNQLAEERLQLSGLEMLGRDLFTEVLALENAAELAREYRRQMERGEVSLESEARLPGGDDEPRLWLGFRSFSFRQVMWGLVVVEDRDAMALEEEQRRTMERLASVGELASGVAHEVNNPLASIRGFAELLVRDSLEPDHRRAVELILKEAGRIAAVVENLIHFARRQEVQGQAPVNLSGLVDEVLESERPGLEAAGIELRRDLDLALSPVAGEREALRQAVQGLVRNAARALADRPGHRLLVVRTRESSEGVLLSVVDNGPGIPRATLPVLFDAHHVDDPVSGRGLGLAASIIRDHGGQIMAESEEGRGAAFFVRLPRALPAPAAAPPPARRLARPGAEPDPEPGAEAGPREASAPIAPVPTRREAARPLRVLVADDEATLRLAISIFLGRRGHRVTEASNAGEALRLAREQPFDVALVDARMPGDGLRLLEQLEAMPELRGRTALMTGDLGRARTLQGSAAGRPYLMKPFDMNDALALIERLGQ